MQLLSFRPEWRIRRAGTPPDRLHCPFGKWASVSGERESNLLLLFLSDSSGTRQQREMSSSDGDKQVCLLQGVAVFNRQLNKRRSRKRRSLAYYSSRATSGRWGDSSLCSCSGIRPAFLDAPCDSLPAESLVNRSRLATGLLDRESRR